MRLWSLSLLFGARRCCCSHQERPAELYVPHLRTVYLHVSAHLAAVHDPQQLHTVLHTPVHRLHTAAILSTDLSDGFPDQHSANVSEAISSTQTVKTEKQPRSHSRLHHFGDPSENPLSISFQLRDWGASNKDQWFWNDCWWTRNSSFFIAIFIAPHKWNSMIKNLTGMY